MMKKKDHNSSNNTKSNHGSNYPRIFLAVDNCFCSKRWTRPIEWAELIAELGIRYVEASADTECDPLYLGIEYLDNWIEDVKKAEKQTGIKVKNIYSGHGTYSTLGLAHTDIQVRKRILEQWVFPMIELASRLNAGMGFYAHAFPESVLQDPAAYQAAYNNLVDLFVQIAKKARERGLQAISVEQMYSPHQIPWTITGAKDFLRQVTGKAQAPLYATIDTGHQCGQKHFLRPSRKTIENIVRTSSKHAIEASAWLGPLKCYELIGAAAEEKYRSEEMTDAILEYVKSYDFLFADEIDADPYSWLEKLGSYSPIIHLQQTTGSGSNHLPFDDTNNQDGIIDGERFLSALQQGFRNLQSGHDPNNEMPEQCKEIYCTLEIFSSAIERPEEILRKIRTSVDYWREYIPKDGLYLNELVNRRAK